MEIKVCTLMEADSLVETWATRTVSLLNPEHAELYKTSATRHFQFFDDISTQPIGYTSWIIPRKEQIAEVLEHTADLKDDDRLLVHCFAGISRSTAMLLGILCQQGYTPQEAVEAVHAVRPIMWPNALITQFCDELLKLDGALNKAVMEYKLKYNDGRFIPSVEALANAGITKEDVDAMNNIKRILAAASEE